MKELKFGLSLLAILVCFKGVPGEPYNNVCIFPGSVIAVVEKTDSGKSETTILLSNNTTIAVTDSFDKAVYKVNQEK